MRPSSLARFCAWEYCGSQDRNSLQATLQKRQNRASVRHQTLSPEPAIKVQEPRETFFYLLSHVPVYAACVTVMLVFHSVLWDWLSCPLLRSCALFLPSLTKAPYRELYKPKVLENCCWLRNQSESCIFLITMLNLQPGHPQCRLIVCYFAKCIFWGAWWLR